MDVTTIFVFLWLHQLTLDPENKNSCLCVFWYYYTLYMYGHIFFNWQRYFPIHVSLYKHNQTFLLCIVFVAVNIAAHQRIPYA